MLAFQVVKLVLSLLVCAIFNVFNNINDADKVVWRFLYLAFAQRYFK